MTQEVSTKQKPTYMQITVSGTTHDCVSRDFSNVRFRRDPGNGRLQHLSQTLTQEQVFDTLAGEADTKKLKDSIVQDQGLKEQPFVSLLPEEDNFEALVREGNRRSVALELILQDIDTGKLDLDRKKFETIRAWVYPNDMPEDHIMLHIASMHNSESGKKPWDKLNQAAYITSLSARSTISDDDIVKGLQISKGTLHKQKKAYLLTMKYGEKHGPLGTNTDPNWKMKYSTFERLFAQKQLNNWHSDPKNIEEYMEWVVNGRIPYAHKVAKIKKILQDAKLLKKFTEARRGGPLWTLDDALIDAEKSTNILNNSKQISMKCDQAVTDLNDFLSLLPTHKLEEMAGSKLLNEYVECISHLQKYVDTVNATKR